MKIDLNANEVGLLHQHRINVDCNRDYTEDEVFDLVEQVRDVEVFYAQDSGTDERVIHMAKAYADLADKIQDRIPE